RQGVLGLADAELHLGLVASGTGGPFQVGRQFLGVGGHVLDAGGKGGGGGGELLAGLVETGGGGGAALGRLLRFCGGLGQLLDALTATGQSVVIEHVGIFRQVLHAEQRLQVGGGLVVVLVGAFEQGKGQAVAGGVGVLVVTELLQELAEAR